MSAEGDSARSFVQSVERALRVILAFDDEHASLTLSDVSRRTDLSRAAARRFLHTLQELGYVRLDDRAFSLTPRVLQLGYAYLSSLRLPEIAEPHLKDLSGQVGESTSASVLDGDDIAYVARVATRRIMSASIAVGTRFPAYATSMGRAILAHFPEEQLDAYFARTTFEQLTPETVTDEATLRDLLARVRADGYAVVDQELEVGLRSVAAPVTDRAGAVVAAINVSTSVTWRDGEDPVPAIVPHLLATARAVSADLAAAGW